ncbi:hypothetical protein N7495_004011 [Penicillium taxi]|uniref:uncharacterized protein n=1 Tax=Penicillium taxi TaxID=168475 RepID=UPI0025450C5D|nr:uncharacterized protein N7495_004011 [Penicillium taxi]KAJ5899267.1 hypothetical protein N7495_004011 [Penicillium taxi]
MYRSFAFLPFRFTSIPSRTSPISPSFLTKISRFSTMGTTLNAQRSDSRPVFFFDIDNCVRIFEHIYREIWLTYDRTCNIHDEMQKLINVFFVKHLNLSVEDAHMLHQKYYQEYGLAIEGLTRHHKIDPLEFNEEVDDALPLENILKPDPKLRQLLERLDTTKVKPWLLTNAYVTHGKKVVKLLGIEDLFEGITFCDYGELPLVCKPSQDMYAKAEREADAPSSESCYFVDDSYLNCVHAEARGWKSVHFVETGFPIPSKPASSYSVSSLHELPVHFPSVFKQE